MNHARVAPPPGAGWYPDPEGHGHRYWDGSAWTTPGAPASRTAAAASTARTGDWIGAVLLALLMPAIGLIAGLFYATRSDARRSVGFVCIALSAAMILLYLALLSAQPPAV